MYIGSFGSAIEYAKYKSSMGEVGFDMINSLMEITRLNKVTSDRLSSFLRGLSSSNVRKQNSTDIP